MVFVLVWKQSANQALSYDILTIQIGWVWGNCQLNFRFLKNISSSNTHTSQQIEALHWSFLLLELVEYLSQESYMWALNFTFTCYNFRRKTNSASRWINKNISQWQANIVNTWICTAFWLAISFGWKLKNKSYWSAYINLNSELLNQWQMTQLFKMRK